MALTRINEVSIRQKFVKAAQAPKFTNFMHSAANTRFVIAREVMLEDFDKHEVTQELKGSPKSRTSKFLSKGNLIAFLGLSNPKELLASVRNFLRTNTNMSDKAKISIAGNRINYGFKVTVPSKSQVFEAFPAPDDYSSRSWLEIIEKGINSIIWYVFWSKGFGPKSNSRSGTGLEIEGANIKNVAKYTPPEDSYISGLIEKFISKFKR